MLADEGEALRVTSIGLKVFERHEIRTKHKGGGGDSGKQGAGGGSGGADGSGGGQQGAASGGGDADGAAAEGGAAGGRGLVRSCHYRLVQEGLPFILSHITKQARGERKAPARSPWAARLGGTCGSLLCVAATARPRHPPVTRPSPARHPPVTRRSSAWARRTSSCC
jgi:hypothetical protein